MDSRLETYRNNSAKVPSISGRVIPEAVFNRADYEGAILHPIYRDLEPYDPDGILRYEWANARGAIARFDRSTIEIRTLDVQECPLADLAAIDLIVGVLKGLVGEQWSSYDAQKRWTTDALAELHLRVIREGGDAAINDASYCAAFGMDAASDATVAQLWRYLRSASVVNQNMSGAQAEARRMLVEDGCLSRRIIKALQSQSDRESISVVYRRLCDCLAEGSMFHA
jgi:carboxylate-amine ligase